MKKIVSLFIILISCLFITGCGDKEIDEKAPVANKSSILDKIDSAGSGKLKCSREAFANEGIDVELSNEIEYDNGYIMILHSIDKVISEDSDSLDQYEDAYKKIAKNYEGLKYYDIKITRDSNSVTNDVVINYGKIDTKKLLDIEGEEDNVIVDGKVALETWVGFAEKFGTVCEKVE